MNPPLARRSMVLLAVAAAALAAAGLLGRGTARNRLSAAASHRQMVEVLAAVRRRMPAENLYLGTALADRQRRQLEGRLRAAQGIERWKLLAALAKWELYQGQERRSVALYDQAATLLDPLAGQLGDEQVAAFQFERAVACLRWAETANCCRRPAAESCIVPIAGQGIHVRQEGSQRATQYLRQVLEQTDPASPLYRKALWLLNVAWMTLGGYPHQVPSPYRIDPGAFASPVPFPRFPNVADRWGVQTFSLAGGAIADDFDGDGRLDLVVSSWAPDSQLEIFWNRGGRLVAGAKAAGLEGILGGLNLVQADYNNDGHLDILVLRGGWMAERGHVPNSLLRNNGNGTFTDVTFRAGLADANYPTQTAGWADYDLDGDLDLYVGNESRQPDPCPCQLFRNNGDGTFRDVAGPAGVTNDRLAKGVVWGDCDGDRWPDLYVSNFGAPNRLYRNLGNGRFEDAAPRTGTDQPLHSFPAWFWDYDNNGTLDLYVAAYSGGIAEFAASLLEQPFDRQHTVARLYCNHGDGTFHDVAASMNLVRPHHPMGANFGDLDNDGFLDFYLGTGWPEYEELLPNAMYRNDQGRRFEDVTTAGGFGHLQKGHAVVFADWDGDGDQDVFEQMGGFFRGDAFYDVLYENPGSPENGSIAVKLVGTRSNRAAIGTRLRLVWGEGPGERSLYRWVTSGGSFGANPLTVHVGTGTDRQVDRLEVFWPRTGQTQVFTRLPVNQAYRITEGNPRPQVTGRWSGGPSPR